MTTLTCGISALRRQRLSFAVPLPEPSVEHSDSLRQFVHQTGKHGRQGNHESEKIDLREEVGAQIKAMLASAKAVAK